MFYLLQLSGIAGERDISLLDVPHIAVGRNVRGVGEKTDGTIVKRFTALDKHRAVSVRHGFTFYETRRLAQLLRHNHVDEFEARLWRMRKPFAQK